MAARRKLIAIPESVPPEHDECCDACRTGNTADCDVNPLKPKVYWSEHTGATATDWTPPHGG